MTATLRRPHPATGVRPPHRWTGSTPAWLRLVTAALIAMAAVTGALGALTVLARSGAVHAARMTAEPLVADAQTAVVKLSDANTTEAGGFLAGPVIPAAARSRFANDLAQASASLTAAAQRAGTDPQISGYLQTVAAGLPVYSGLIATAEAANRQGQPVGAAYLAEANHFMDSSLLPAVYRLYSAEQARLAHDDARATGAALVIVLIILMAALLAALLYLQAGLARRFRRLVNTGAVVATVAVLVLAIWVIVGVAAEGAAVSRAEHHGTDPLDTLTQARILAGQARADDELTLVTRDEDPTYQQDYRSVAAQLNHLLDRVPPGWTGAEKRAAAGGAAAWAEYGQTHRTVRQEDGSGQLSAAIRDDQRISSPSAATLDATLAGGVNGAVASFDRSADAAQSDLSGLMWGSLVLMVLAIIGVLAGTRPRLQEYR